MACLGSPIMVRRDPGLAQVDAPEGGRTGPGPCPGTRRSWPPGSGGGWPRPGPCRGPRLASAPRCRAAWSRVSRSSKLRVRVRALAASTSVRAKAAASPRAATLRSRLRVARVVPQRPAALEVGVGQQRVLVALEAMARRCRAWVRASNAGGRRAELLLGLPGGEPGARPGPGRWRGGPGGRGNPCRGSGPCWLASSSRQAVPVPGATPAPDGR